MPPPSTGSAAPSVGTTAYPSPDLATALSSTVDNESPPATTESAIVGASLRGNTSNYLEIREEAAERTAQDRASLNIAGAVQQDVTALRSEYASLTFEQRYENTTGREARMNVLRSEVDRLERRVQQLELRRNQAIDEYNSGEMETAAFYRELVAIDTAARAIESQFARVRKAAGWGCHRISRRRCTTSRGTCSRCTVRSASRWRRR
ncbi:hypothetical protein ACFQL4_22625 [Halosimplex aquaticum]